MKVNLTELRNSAVVAKPALWAAAGSMGRDVKLYCHWTGGWYDALGDDYHINILQYGSIDLTNALSTVLAAIYMRNTGSVAIAMDCAVDAVGQYDLGPCPPTEAQIESMAQVIAVLADVLDLTIDLQRVMTHAEAADNMDGWDACEPYGPAHTVERWDLAVLHPGDEWMSGGDILRGKAIYYQNQWRADE